MAVAGKLESENTDFVGSKYHRNRPVLPARFKSWLGSWPEWGSLLLLFLALEIAVRSIEQAQWITPQPPLTVILALAVLTGWLLSKSRLPGTVSYPLAVVLGATVTVWQASSLLPPLDTASSVSQLVVALQSWWRAVSAAEPSEGTIHFAVFLICATWVIGYLSTWYILKRQNAWVAVSLGAITILVNLDNLPQQHYTFFLFYLLAALLLVGTTSLAKHHYWFKKHDINYPRRGIFYLATSLLCLSILAVAIAWLTPEVRVEPLETLISTKTLWRKNIENHFSNFLAAVPAKQPFLKSGEQGELLFGDSYGLGDELQFVVFSDRPYYLRSRMYNVYTSSGWTSSNATESIFSQGSSSSQDDGISQRRAITYTVIAKVRTDLLLTGGEFVSSDIPISVRSLVPPSFSIDLIYPAADSALPPDVVSLAGSLRASQVANEEINLDELWRLLPGDLTLTDVSATRYRLVQDEDALELVPVSTYLDTVKVTRTQPVSSAIVAVTSLRPIKTDRRYTVTTSISSATTEDLAEAGDDYPYWVTDYYLQLPPTLPERLSQLSETVTREAKTPYDKAVAIKHYLSQFTYALEVKAPPQEVDGVDHFLFTEQSGNCVQFASAMTVMLRSVGVPSRFSSGYAPGEWDAATGSATLRAKDRHTWSEVYFPGYGWVEFEATPAVGSELEAIADIDSLGGNRPSDAYQDEGLDEDIVGGQAGAGGPVTTSPNQWRITLLFVITAAVLLAYTLWSALAHRRQRFVRSDYASEVYRKMCFLASLVRLSPRPQQTPWEYYARLTSVFPQQAESFDCIVQTYVERRFSRGKELDIWQKGRLRKSWNSVYPTLLKCLFHIRY